MARRSLGTSPVLGTKKQMPLARRSTFLIAALLVVTVVASPSVEAKKRERQPVAQRGIRGSVTIPFMTPPVDTTLASAVFFPFDWTDPDNASATIEASWEPGPGLDPGCVTCNDIDIFLWLSNPDGTAWDQNGWQEPPSSCNTPEPTGSGCAAVNGKESLRLAKLPADRYWAEFWAHYVYRVNIEVDFLITFFNKAGQPGPPPEN